MTPHLRFVASVCLALTVGLSACSRDKPAVAARPTADPMQVQAPDNLLSQLTLGAAQQVQVAETLRVAGTIDFDEFGLTRIGASVTGRVNRLYAHLGQYVKTGDPLAQIHSSELSSAQLAFLKARSQTELLRRNAQRARTRAAMDQLRVLGMSTTAIERLADTGIIDSNATVSATLSGVVVERKVASGQVVQPSDAMFVVADLKRVWAVAQVPEQQVGQVRVGQAVLIEVPALDNEKLVGKLIYVGQTVNPDTRTVLVRTELDNRDGRLKPAMLASMLIQSNPQPQLTVPSRAVVREDDEDHVFVETAPGQFRLTRVKLAPEREGQRVVLDGLKDGTRIVTDGAFHLNNHRNLAASGGGN